MPATVLLAATMYWPFPAQLAGAFAAAGARVEALCPQEAILAESCHVSRLHRHQILAPHRSLRRALARATPDLVIPCDDDAAEILQRVRGAAPFPGRSDFLAQAAAAGAPIADNVGVADEAALEAAMRRFGLPLAVKCERSWGGDGVVIASTREQARQAFQRFRAASRLRDVARAVYRQKSHFLTRALFPAPSRISVQRFVDGTPATSSLACWNGRLVAAHHFDVMVTARENGPASVVVQADCGQMQDSARRVAAALNLTGLFGLDYIRDSKGAVHLLEMNPRATPTAHLALAQDPAVALLAAAGFPARARPVTTPAREVALFPREWLRDHASPWLKTTFHDVPWDDPAVVRACMRPAGPTPRELLEIQLQHRSALRTPGRSRAALDEF